MSDRFTGGERPSTGRRPEPATAGRLRPPGFLDELTVKLGHVVGRGIDRSISGRHRLRLRQVGWEHALDATGTTWARGTFQPRDGNKVDVLVDGSEALPRMARDMGEATSHVHLTGWFLSPELQLSREEEPLVVRTLLARLAERIDVRVLLWKGAPLAVFRPTRDDVEEVHQKLTRHTAIQCATDSCTGASHCHHEKTIVIDDRIAYVGGIDLTIDGGDPYDTPSHRARGGIGWHDAAVRIEGPAVKDVAEHFRLRWHGATKRVARPAGRARARRRRDAPGRAHASRRCVPPGQEGRLLDPRVVSRRVAVGGAARLPREPVSLVAGGRQRAGREARHATERRLPHRRAPAGPRQ